MSGSLEEYQIFVTGAAGFLGRLLIPRLVAEGVYVVGLDLAAVPPRFEALISGYKPSFLYLRGDLNSIQFLNQVFHEIPARGKRYLALFHLSGCNHAGQCHADPLAAYSANVFQTVQILEACRKAGINHAIYPSSGLVYGENSAGPFTETDPVNPKSIYASTKLAAEAVFQGYGGAYSFSCDIVRLSNVYGADAHPDTAVSTALRQAREEKSVTLKTLKPVRDFIFCEDVVEGLVRLLKSGQESGCRIFNLSTGHGVSIGQMVHIVCEMAGAKSGVAEDCINDDSGESTLVLANDALARRTGWRPVFSLHDGIKAVWEEMNR